MSAEDIRNETTTIRLAEYQALRAEILNRNDSQRQYLSLAILAAGTIFAASVLNKDPAIGALLILGYPVLSLFLAAGWGHHDRRVVQIGTYIRDHIEEQLGPDRMGWEHTRLGRALSYFPVRGIFVGTEIFAIFVGSILAKVALPLDASFVGAPLPPIDRISLFLMTDVASVLLTFLVLLRTKRPAG